MHLPLALLSLLTLPQDTTQLVPPAELTHAKLGERLKSLDTAHDHALVLPLGRSREGLEVLAVRLSDGDPPPGRPAILLVANVDGPHVFSSTLALYVAEELARRFAAGDEPARALLAETTLYVVPRVNVDAAESRFATPLFENETSGRGVDNDRDGRTSEDGPADVDGDGQVLTMRWEDPEGEWIPDPTDARALVKADAAKGQTGRYKVAVESRDSDGDEEAGEDPAHDTRLNASFPHEWQEHAPDAGLFPLDEPEARALADFVLLHPDIALVVTYGVLDNLVEKPKGSGGDAGGGAPGARIPRSGPMEADAKLLEELGRRYVEATKSKVAGRGSDKGSFQAWAYQHRGLLSLAIAPWDIPTEAEKKEGEKKKEGAETPPEKAEGEKEAPPADPKQEKPEKEKQEKKDEPKPSDDAKRLAWCDSAGEGQRFRAWQASEHPELGPVEIGGFVPFTRYEPPAAKATEIAGQQLEFLLGLGPTLPRVAVSELTAKDLGGGLVEVRAAITNAALLPLQTAAGRRAQQIRPARVRLLHPEGAEVIAGATQELVRDLEGSGGRQEFRWLVKSVPGAEMALEVDTDNAGVARKIVEVE